MWSFVLWQQIGLSRTAWPWHTKLFFLLIWSFCDYGCCPGVRTCGSGSHTGIHKLKKANVLLVSPHTLIISDSSHVLSGPDGTDSWRHYRLLLTGTWTLWKGHQESQFLQPVRYCSISSRVIIELLLQLLINARGAGDRKGEFLITIDRV